MHNSALKSAVLALYLSAAAPGAAAEIQDLPTLTETIELWLVVTFGLTAAAEPPDLVSIPASELVEIRYGSASSVAPGEVVAAYDEESRTIYLTEGWTGQSPGQLSVLVHEMVHHLQASAVARFACPAEREMLAYRAQDAWLQLFGTDLERTFGIDETMRLVGTVCTH
jgi:hypothetical protein